MTMGIILTCALRIIFPDGNCERSWLMANGGLRVMVVHWEREGLGLVPRVDLVTYK